MCVDFRTLNYVTKQISFHLPDSEDVVDAMSEAHPKYFSVLDLKSGFYQISLYPDAQMKTTVVTHSDQYNYPSLPMAMTNAPISFPNFMTKVLKGQNFKNLLCSFDDVIIFRMDSTELRLHPEKCKFTRPKVLY